MSNLRKGRLYGLDLFSGIGGNTLGLSDYIKTIAYCEANRHAQAILLSRMGDGSIPLAPIWDDIRTLSRTSTDIPIDIIIGGFPCQDISLAGKGAGLGGERSSLFYEIVRLAKEFQPPFVYLENVPAIRTRGLDTIIQEFTQIGYDCRWTMLSAGEIGAPHKRERWFMLAHSNKQDDQPQSRSLGETPSPPRKQERGDGFISSSSISPGRWWKTEPTMGRVGHGIPQRLDRLERLGNAVVPEQAKIAFEYLMGIV